MTRLLLKINTIRWRYSQLFIIFYYLIVTAYQTLLVLLKVQSKFVQNGFRIVWLDYERVGSVTSQDLGKYDLARNYL